MNEVAIRLNAGNDSNGNPRRIFVVINPCTDDIVDSIDEGYIGTSGLFKKYPSVNYTGTTIDTSPSQYRELKKQFGE